MCIVVASGCGSDGDGTSIGAAAKNTDFPLLWLGESFDGNELDEVQGHGGAGGMFYGSCEPEGIEGGCPAPYEVQEQSPCDGFRVAGRPRLGARMRRRASL